MKGLALDAQGAAVLKEAGEEDVEVDENQVSVQVEYCLVDERVIESRRGSESLWPVGDLKPVFIGWEVAGCVKKVGSGVKRLKPGDKVLALPRGGNNAMCAKTVVVHNDEVVPRPDKVDSRVAISLAKPSILAYTAVHYKMRLEPDELVLVCNPSDALSWLSIQLISLRGAFAVLLATNDQQYQELKSTWECLSCIVVQVPDCPSEALLNEDDTRPLDKWVESVVSTLLSYTDGAGFNHVLDTRLGAGLESKGGNDSGPQAAAKHDQGGQRDEAVLKRRAWQQVWLKCLSVHSTLVTRDLALELGADETLSLARRGSSLAFLNECPWYLSPVRRSNLLHILEDVMLKTEVGKLDPPPLDEAPFDSAPNSITRLLGDAPSDFRLAVRL